VSKYNRFLESQFSGCRLLAHAVDNCRNRQVRVYALPGEFSIVGVSDGVDAWLAPVIADPFSVNVGRLLDRLRAGEDIKVEPLPSKRPRILVQVPTQPKERVRVRC